jgi:hypothetical protein
MIWTKRWYYKIFATMILRTAVPVSLALVLMAGVVLFAMYRDPAFDLKQWQTILSALIALTAATLAYSAAMAKVRFDENTARQTEYRKTLGVFLRFDFAMDVLKYEAKNFLVATDAPASSAENNILEVNDLALSEMPEIKEAWSNLDYFPVELSRSFYSVQNAVYNLVEFKKDHADETYPVEFGMTASEDLVYLRDILEDLHRHSEEALQQVRAEISALRKRMIA